MRTPLLLVLSSSLLLSACAAKRVETVEADDGRSNARQTPPQVVKEQPVAPEGLESAPPTSLDVGPLYYELDSARLTPESMATLDAVADWLRAHKGSRITLSGHTCELGTSEYNLALGQQRAKVARDYLARLGVADSDIVTISYGEEHPAVAGASENAWRKNRRTEFDISAATKR